MSIEDDVRRLWDARDAEEKASKDLADRKNRDLDETRRLLYGCLMASHTRRWEVIGTVANALLHHGHDVDINSWDLLDLLLGVVERSDATGKAWIRSQIERINARLAESADAGSADVVGDPGNE